MRTREEILQSQRDGASIGKLEIMQQTLILEILLDIRDLLLKEKE